MYSRTLFDMNTGFKECLRVMVNYYYLQLRLNHTEGMQDCYERLLNKLGKEMDEDIEGVANSDKLFEGHSYIEKIVSWY